MLFMGYANQTKRVKFQNSWGKSWGDFGFGSLPYDMFTDGFVSDCWTIRRQEM